jgi:DNA topoisomerase
MQGQKQNLVRLIPEQHFTQPPPRYSEASLVQALEEDGIGRPSTYAPTLSTIQQRGYVLRENKRLVPTEVGIQVNDLMVKYFPEIVDLNFTARMDGSNARVLSAVCRGCEKSSGRDARYQVGAGTNWTHLSRRWRRTRDPLWTIRKIHFLFQFSEMPLY